ncbi:hypothetical protein IDR12_000424 [Salmonella enterica]|nr:hypothetical protein [Salmonella enterica]EJK8997418.1 hypothetical protein [Salmonella enterica]
MKVIDEKLLTAISGARGAPATPANTIGASIIVGAISGIPGGPGGMVGGAVVAPAMIYKSAQVYTNLKMPLVYYSGILPIYAFISVSNITHIGLLFHINIQYNDAFRHRYSRLPMGDNNTSDV